MSNPPVCPTIPLDYHLYFVKHGAKKYLKKRFYFLKSTLHKVSLNLCYLF
jgi:hypothetical protein